MGIKSNLQNSAFQQALKSRLRKSHFNRIEMNLARARKVALVVDISDKDSTFIRKINDYAAKLRGLDKHVAMIGYTDVGAIPDAPGFDCFCKKDLNWALVPKGEVVDRFLGNDYDILINLNQQTSQSVDFLFQLAKAHIKVAYYYNEEIIAAADVLFHNAEDDFELYLEEILTHLKRINN